MGTSGPEPALPSRPCVWEAGQSGRDCGRITWDPPGPEIPLAAAHLILKQETAYEGGHALQKLCKSPLVGTRTSAAKWPSSEHLTNRSVSTPVLSCLLLRALAHTAVISSTHPGPQRIEVLYYPISLILPDNSCLGDPFILVARGERRTFLFSLQGQGV